MSCAYVLPSSNRNWSRWALHERVAMARTLYNARLDQSRMVDHLLGGDVRQHGDAHRARVGARPRGQQHSRRQDRLADQGETQATRLLGADGRGRHDHLADRIVGQQHYLRLPTNHLRRPAAKYVGLRPTRTTAGQVERAPRRLRGSCRLVTHHFAIEGVGTRTQDLRLKRPLLYRLSYTPLCDRTEIDGDCSTGPRTCQITRWIVLAAALGWEPPVRAARSIDRCEQTGPAWSRTLCNRTRRVRAMRRKIQEISAGGPTAGRCWRVVARPSIGDCRFRGIWRDVSVYVRITSRGRIAVVASGGSGAYDWHGRAVPRAGACDLRERRATAEPNGTCHIAIRRREVSICLARFTETRDVVRLP